jgi:glutathione synthase/RimK-type ligase-like ATP-grasp enzyme
VTKPTVSASAHGLERVFVDNAVAKIIRGPAMVQPFLPEVAIEGEWSMVFLGGKYSHAVLKVPAAGDFRVQAQFGGSASSAEPSPNVLEAANRIIATLAETPRYARVDGIIHEGEFVLMEMELIEPELFLRMGGAADRFADVILNSGDD